MMISMDKKYRTRDGREVRLLCVDGPEDTPIIGLIGPTTAKWRSDGRWTQTYAETIYDLIEYHEPDIRTIWVNVYECGRGYELYALDSKDEALSSARPDAISIAQPVTFEVKRDR